MKESVTGKLLDENGIELPIAFQMGFVSTEPTLIPKPEFIEAEHKCLFDALLLIPNSMSGRKRPFGYLPEC